MATRYLSDDICSDDSKFITILAIDGGGVRGIIPAVILSYLEEQLQKIDERPDKRIADYFDVIAGTSTGGLIAALLTAPDQYNRPVKSAKEILEFYNVNNMRKVFKPNGMLKPFFWGPKYDAKGLLDIANKELGDVPISKTVTDLVIPTFDMKLNHPVIFTTNEGKHNFLKNPKLSNVCVATAAAPTYFPPHYFAVKNIRGTREYNLVDGGVTANNPTKCAMNYVSNMLAKRDQDFYPNFLMELLKDKMNNFEPIKPKEYSRFLIISLGTGQGKKVKYSAKDAASWGIAFGWFANNGQNPLTDFFMEASSDMVDFNVEVDFNDYDTTKKGYSEVDLQYLRIQTDDLEGKAATMDNIEEGNLKSLREIGKNLLDKNVSKVDLETGEYVEIDKKVTNKEALTSLAKVLSRNRKISPSVKSTK